MSYNICNAIIFSVSWSSHVWSKHACGRKTKQRVDEEA